MNLERLPGFNCELFRFRFGNSYRMKNFKDFMDVIIYALENDPEAKFVIYNHEDFSETSMDIPKEEDLYKGGSFFMERNGYFEFKFDHSDDADPIAAASVYEALRPLDKYERLKTFKTNRDIRAWYMKCKDKSYFIINQAKYKLEVKEFTKIKTLKDLKDAMWRYDISFPVWYSQSSSLLYGLGFKTIKPDFTIILDNCNYCSEVPKILLKDVCTFDNTDLHQKSFSVTTDVSKKSISSADIANCITAIKNPEDYKDNAAFDLDGTHNRYYFLCCYAGGVYTGFILSREYVPYPC